MITGIIQVGPKVGQNLKILMTIQSYAGTQNGITASGFVEHISSRMSAKFSLILTTKVHNSIHTNTQFHRLCSTYYHTAYSKQDIPLGQEHK